MNNPNKFPIAYPIKLVVNPATIIFLFFNTLAIGAIKGAPNTPGVVMIYIIITTTRRKY